MRKSISALARLVTQPKQVSQIYPDTYLKAYTHDHHMRAGETRTGELTMTEEDEQFEFVEKLTETYRRNPKVFRGEYINVHRDKEGHYQIHLRKMELNRQFSPVRVGNAIQRELLTAKKVLGV